MAQPSADLIRGIPIFAELDDASVSQLATDFIERDFRPGQEIATEGDRISIFAAPTASKEVEALVTMASESHGAEPDPDPLVVPGAAT